MQTRSYFIDVTLRIFGVWRIARRLYINCMLSSMMLYVCLCICESLKKFCMNSKFPFIVVSYQFVHSDDIIVQEKRKFSKRDRERLNSYPRLMRKDVHSIPPMLKLSRIRVWHTLSYDFHMRFASVFFCCL